MVVAAARTIGADFLASCPQLGCVHDIGVCSGRQAEDLGRVAIDERQVDDGFLIDDSSQSSVLRLKERRLRANRDLFLCAADWKLNLESAHLGNLSVNSFQDDWLKSGRANRYVIVPRREEWDPVIPPGIRSEMSLFLCGLALDNDCRTRDQRS